MLNKFHALFFLLSAIFILSCNQNSEEKADHKETKEVTKKEVTNTNSDCPRCTWAIKKEPDGTITKVMREAADGSYIRPDGFEWKKVQGESPRKYLREPSTFEGTLEEGVTGPDDVGPGQGKTAIFKIANPYDEDDTTSIDAELIDFHRANALRKIMEYILSEFAYECDGIPFDPKVDQCPFEVATNVTASGMLYDKKVAGSEVSIHVASMTTDHEGTPKSGHASQPYDFVDNIIVGIAITTGGGGEHEQHSSLSLETTTTIAKPTLTTFTWSQQAVTSIEADPSLATTHDFFLKLSELGIISERWNLDNPAFDLGYSLYFKVFKEH